MAYRTYLTDTLFYMGRQQALTVRFCDIMNHKIDTRTPDEIALDVIKKGGLVVN
nr:MAG TPA: hypothetical protein [Caudoviricetes sp.]